MAVVSIPVEKWSHSDLVKVTKWLKQNYNDRDLFSRQRWYFDPQPGGVEDLVMDRDIYFVFRTIWPTL